MVSDLNRTYVQPLLIAASVFLLVNGGLYWLIVQPQMPAASAPVQEVASTTASETPATAIPQDMPTAPAGEWSKTGSTVIQQAALTQDMVFGTGFIAEHFTASVEITLPAGSADAGGGLLFHMANRDALAQSQMVRLADGGKTLLWGYYDDTSAFIGEGSLPITTTGPTALKVLVLSETYSIQINNVTIVDQLPLHYSSGYLAYLSFSGPISFDNLNILLTS